MWRRGGDVKERNLIFFTYIRSLYLLCTNVISGARIFMFLRIFFLRLIRIFELLLPLIQFQVE